jgi:hypothetical protein
MKVFIRQAVDKIISEKRGKREEKQTERKKR